MELRGTMLIVVILTTCIVFSPFGRCQSVCPGRCLCHLAQQPRAVMCVKQGLQEFPRNISDVVEHLDVSNNHLTEIPDSINKLIELQYLNLAKNNLFSLPNDLTALTKLKRLDLSSNNIVHMDSILSISELPSLVILYISRNPLFELDGFRSKVLQALDASHCAIRELSNTSLNGLPALTTLSLAGNPLKLIHNPSSARLKWIDLSNCLLNYLSPDTFSGFPELDELRLSDNPKLVYSTRHSTLRHANLKRLDVSWCNLDRPGLHGLPLLTHARLSHNTIRLLPDRIFSRNRQLTHLFLNSNGLEHLNASTFEGLVKLQILDISANGLEDVHRTMFRDNIDLRLLNLSYNSLYKAPKLMSAVTSLDLSSNLIGEVESDELTNMPRIRTLNLSDNKIQSIPGGLKSLTLTGLDFKRNRLVELKNNTFFQLPELRVVDLSGNRLTEAMSPDVFRNNLNLVSVRLEDNPWRCDCTQLYVTYEFLTSTPAKTPESSLICQSPSNVSGYSWESACFSAWHGSLYYNKDRTWGLVLVSLLTLVVLSGSVVSIRHTMRIKRRAVEQRQELERAEARERLRLLQRRNQRLEELSDRPPEPRINPLELIGPPSYEEAVHMPRLAQSLDALNDISTENISMRTLGSVDNLRSKKRRARRPRKRTQSEDDLLKRQERREIRLRRERHNSTGNILDDQQPPVAVHRSGRSSSTRRIRRQSVAEDQQDSEGSRGRPRPQTPSARKKKRQRVVRNGHSSDDEDSDVKIFVANRSITIRELRKEPRSGYRDRGTDVES